MPPKHSNSYIWSKYFQRSAALCVEIRFIQLCKFEPRRQNILNVIILLDDSNKVLSASNMEVQV